MENLDIHYFGEVQLSYQRKKSQITKITSSRMASDYIRSLYPEGQINHRESMYVIYLNNSNKIIGYYHLSSGGITGTLVDVRLVFQGALLTNSVAMILAHNHPSGTLKASSADKAITKKISIAGESLDIKLLDHIIVTEDSYFSFADENLL
ncbi:DNA repair protein [Kordia sp. TARA_039_SRF]|nr:DNA repair protein [Kordia sp. TARA_039_SRF]